MAFTLANAEGILKQFYLPGIREQINQQCAFLAQIEKNTEDVEGLEAVVSLHVKRNAGTGARADGGTLPAAGSQKYVKERVALKYLYGIISITGPTIAAAKSNAGSFAPAIKGEVKGITDDVRRDTNRQCWGTSDGVIATCGTSGPSTTVSLATATTTVQLNQLFADQIIDIVTFSGGVATPIANGDGVTITAIDTAAKTIVISGSGVSVTGADFIVVHGNGGSGASQLELTGIQTQVAGSGTLFNVNPTTYPVWVSTVDHASSNRPISENLIEGAGDNVHQACGEDVDLLMSSYGVRRAVANLLKSQKRFVNTTALKAGYSGIEVDLGTGKPATLLAERDAPSNILWGFNTSHWFEFSESDWGFTTEDGGNILLRQSGPGGTDAYAGTLRKYMEVVTDQRNANFKIDAIIEA